MYSVVHSLGRVGPIQFCFAKLWEATWESHQGFYAGKKKAIQKLAIKMHDFSIYEQSQAHDRLETAVPRLLFLLSGRKFYRSCCCCCTLNCAFIFPLSRKVLGRKNECQGRRISDLFPFLFYCNCSASCISFS
ncbi:unnamed protein product [Sphagnum jensenii]|uniref:Uncharacterized protein n=1 Tax=Sphagnum jensenii TaxID=128206 RepID=A0ABP0W3I7_9BRYO